MNRHERRVAAKQPSALTAAEDYRVPDGKVAITLDFAGWDPSTLAIDAASLTDVVAGVDKLVAGRTYQHVLQLLGAGFKAAKSGGSPGAFDICLLGYWLALNHPQFGLQMRQKVADALVLDGRAHITFHASKGRGIAFALGDRFVDLDQAAAAARRSNVSAVMLSAPRQERPGGRA